MFLHLSLAEFILEDRFRLILARLTQETCPDIYISLTTGFPSMDRPVYMEARLAHLAR